MRSFTKQHCGCVTDISLLHTKTTEPIAMKLAHTNKQLITMDKDGMVAVVRGTTNSGLCVTLLDGTRQYTLLPNTVTHSYQGTTSKASQAVGPNQYAVENSAQAVDGRYASVYQTVHCNMVPTSPTVDVSEFPPQRAALSKGHGNFEVGGLGSGETSYYPSRVTDSFRGGMNWPERGSVFSPRPSVEPDRFASSLRKYPSLSAERSSEMVERLINYTQLRNSKTQRLQTLRSEFSNRPKKTFEADIRTDESPTRERSRRFEDIPSADRYERSRRDDDRYRKYDEGDRRFDRSYDVRNFRDVSRRARETAVRNVQISIDTQVEIPRMSKEVETVSKITPSVRNVAIPMSPLPSNFTLPTSTVDTKTSKSIQTLKTPNIHVLRRKSVQTCFSSIDITNKKIKNGRKSKSQEELRDNEVEDEVLQLVQYLTDSEERGTLRDDLVKKLKKICKADKSDRLKVKFGRCVRDQLFSEMDLKDFTRELSNQLLFKMKRNSLLHCNLTNSYRADIQSHRNDNDDNCVDDVIKQWLRDIPIKNRDYLGKSIKKDHLLLTVANKIKDIVMSKLKLDSDKSLKIEIIQLIEDIPIAVCGFEKRLYLNRLATDLIRRIKEIITMCNHKVGKSNTDNKNKINDEITSKGNTNKEEEIKCYVREELANFVRKFQLTICTESMHELEVELTDIVLDAIVTIQTGKEAKVKEDILSTLNFLLTISEYQANYFANNMILNMKKMFNGGPKIKSQTFFVLDTQKRVNNTQGLMDENNIKANLVWYTNQIVQKIKEWISSIEGLDPNNNFTKVVMQELAGDIVDRHKYLELNPTIKVSKTDEIEHLKYQIFKSINKLVGDDNLETIEKAPDLMERIKNIPVPMLIKPQNTVQEYCQMCCDCYNRPRSNTRRANITVNYRKEIGRSNNITVAIGSITRDKAQPSDSEESRIGPQTYNKANSLPEQSVKPNTKERMSDPTDNRQSRRSSSKDGQSCCDNKQCDMPAEQKTQEQIIEEFDQFLKEWVQRIPMSENPKLIEKCRLGIYNGIWKAITKIKMNPEGIDNPLLYKDVLDDEIEELLDCLTQTPELKKERNGLKAEVLEKAADINMNEAPAALNTSYRQQLVQNISNNLPKTENRVEHIEEDANILFEEAMKLHLAEYFILYTKYKEDDTIKANVFKRKLLKEVHVLVDGIKQAHGKELREIEIKHHVEGIIHALQKVPVPNDEAVNLETDEIILALEVEQWFSDLPLMPNEERIDMLSRIKYRDMLAKKLFDLENSNETDSEEQMKEEITKFLKRMPFIRGEAENIPFMVDELMTRIKNRPRYDTDDDNKNFVAFVEPHGYEAFSRDMPLCSSYTEDQNGSSYFIVGGERATDRSMAYGGQHVQGRKDPDSQQEWPSLEQSSANRPTGSHITSPRDPDSQQEWLTLEQTAAPGAMKGSRQGASLCCGRPTCSHSTSPPPQCDPNSQQEWLTLEPTAAPGAMEGSPQGASPCCGQPTLLHSTSLPPQRDPNTQQERLPLRRSSSPGAMKCSSQLAGPQGSASLPPQKWLPSQQEQHSFEQSRTPSPVRRTSFTPQASTGSCCKRASCLSQISTQSQTAPIPDLSERRTDDFRDGKQSPSTNISKKKSKTPKVPKSSKISKGRIVICECPPADIISSGQSPPAEDTGRFSKVCKRRIVICKCPPADTVSRGQSPATSGVSRSQSSNENSKPLTSNSKAFKTPNNLTRKSPPASKVSRGQSPATGKVSRGQSPATGKVSSQSSDEKSEPVTSKTRFKKCKKTPKVKCECFETPKVKYECFKTRNVECECFETTKIPPVDIVSSQSSDEKSKTVTSNSKVFKTPNNLTRKSPPAGKGSRGQSPVTGKVSSQSSDEKSKTLASKTCVKKCKEDPKAECECFETPNNETSKTPLAGGVSRSQLSNENAEPVTSNSKVNKTPNNVSRKSPRAGKVSSQSSDEESEPVTSKTCVKKCKKPTKVKCECFETSKVEYECFKTPKVKCECYETPNITSVDIVSSQSSDDKSEPEPESKTCGKNCKKEPKFKVKCECFVTPNNPPAITVSRGQSPDSSGQSSDEESRPITSKKPQTTKSVNDERDYCTTKSNGTLTQTQSNLPESTRRAGPEHSCDSPEEYSGRPATHSAQHGTAGPPNMSGAKKRSRDIEQERREAARRRVDRDQTEESEEDDIRCKCQERIWRWRHSRQCKPCNNNTDFMYPFPMMCPPPPCFNRFMNMK